MVNNNSAKALQPFTDRKRKAQPTNNMLGRYVTKAIKIVAG